MSEPITATDTVNELGALWSSNFDDYAAGRIEAHQIVCVLCETSPCTCPPFGSDEYLALMDRRHGRSGQGAQDYQRAD